MAFEDGDGPVMDRFERAAPFAAERIAPVPSVASLLERIRRSAARPKSACPEIDCVRERLPLDVLAAVERRAAEVGVGADRVLIAAGICDEDSYMMALAASLGLAFETFDRHGRASCPLDPGRLVEAAKTGLLPLMVGGKLAVVVAPRSVRQFVDYVARNPQVTFRLTSTRRLNRFVFGDYERALGHMASEALVETAPHLSAATRSTTPWIIGGVIASIFFSGFIISPGATMELFGTILAVCFLLWLLLRVLSSCIGSPPTQTTAIPDRQLPVYTVIAALYREADSVEDLIGSLAALDYPPEKLDIKLVLERHDLETWTAIKRLNPGAPFEIIMAPDHGPRTKPKALNAALPFARGTFTVIYDAEDRPEPDQLRIALGRFRDEDARVACVQASLTIDNTADSWLSRMFTAEYAAQFDLFLPGLALMKLPLPLGGSSNHFRTSVLREVGAWDSYNVTEDADLGMRLARLGYRSTVIGSTTYEEAPAHFGPWVRQRTRWFKGWMQTWCVHTRRPFQLFRDLGIVKFAAFHLLVGGNVFAPLVHPMFLVAAIWAVAERGTIAADTGEQSGMPLFWVSWGAGYLITALLDYCGLVKRGLQSSAWALLLLPVHWLLLSFAAWRALFQLMRDPHVWEKTTHGVAQSSRRSRPTRPAQQPPVTIERAGARPAPLRRAA